MDDGVKCVAFSPKDNMVCSESDDCEIVVNDVESNVLARLKGHAVLF
jgi:hypothetical protein